MPGGAEFVQFFVRTSGVYTVSPVGIPELDGLRGAEGAERRSVLALGVFIVGVFPTVVQISWARERICSR